MLLSLLGSLGWVLYNPFPLGQDGLAYDNGYGVRWENGSTPFNLSSVVWRWGASESLDTGVGLQRGITWALSPAFCPTVLAFFPEDSIGFTLTCDDLRAAIASAFNTWAMNNDMLSFDDVTDDCAVDGAVSSITGNCALAEVWIETFDNTHPDVAAGIVLPNAAAYLLPELVSRDSSPMTTTGQHLPVGLGMRRADLRLSTEVCWYLDATFCSTFNQAKGGDVRNARSERHALCRSPAAVRPLPPPYPAPIASCPSALSPSPSPPLPPFPSRPSLLLTRSRPRRQSGNSGSADSLALLVRLGFVLIAVVASLYVASVFFRGLLACCGYEAWSNPYDIARKRCVSACVTCV